MNWPMRQLGDIAVVQGGIQKQPKRSPKDNPYPFLRVANVTAEGLDLGDVHSVELFDGELDRYRLQKGDLLVVEGNGSASQIGRAALWDGSIENAVHQNHLIRVRPGDSLDPRFLGLAWNSPRIRHELTTVASSTSGLHTLSVTKIKGIRVPVPPLNEQRRIVEILEDHFSRLDAAEDYLDAVDHRIRLLERAALATCRDGEVVPLSDVTKIQGGIQKQPKRAPRNNHYPFLRVANVGSGRLDLADIHRVELFDDELDRLRLERGDLLVVEGNGSPSQIGRAALWDGSIENAVHQNHLIRVRPDQCIYPQYLAAVWNSPQNRRILTDISSSSSGLHTLSVSKLKRVSIPVPSLERQAELVAQVDAMREVTERVATAVADSRKRARTLRRSLLAAAFSGRLTDEIEKSVPLEAELVPA